MMLELDRATIKPPHGPPPYHDMMGTYGHQSSLMSTIVVFLIIIGAVLYLTFGRRPAGRDQVADCSSDQGRQFYEDRVRELHEQGASGPLGAIDPNESIVKTHARSHMD